MTPRTHKPTSRTDLNSGPHASSDQTTTESALMQLRIAEYQALTNRCGYWMIMPTAIWPILLVGLALLAQLHGFIQTQLLVWTGATLVQFIIGLHYNILTETYRAVSYIENVLRPQLVQTANSPLFWGYEPYLDSMRRSEALLGEYWPSAISLLSTVSATALRLSAWTAIDFVGLIINITGLALALRCAYKATHLRVQWSQLWTDVNVSSQWRVTGRLRGV
jgi:hypothetical protein